MTAKLLLYILKETLTKAARFPNIYYHTSFQNPVLLGTSFAPASQFRASDILLLQIVRNKKIRGWGGLQWRNIHTRFRKSRSTGSNVEREHTHTHTHTHTAWWSHKPTFISLRKESGLENEIRLKEYSTIFTEGCRKRRSFPTLFKYSATIADVMFFQTCKD